MKSALRKIYFILLLLIVQQIRAQNQYPQNYFASPLDIPLELAGSFGELRNNHFHSGVDFRTQEKEGLNIYAPANGYVSRIKVSAYGFGNALYITHPNGFVTVYGHLQSFNEKITAYLSKMQYEKESFEVDLTVPKNKIKITKAEVIAISGNTGGTEGPHLHFEIRDKKKEHPINPLLFGYKVKDSIPPIIEGIKCFDEITGTDFNLDIKSLNGNYFIDTKDTMIFPTLFSMGISTYDLMNNNKAKNGIYQLELWLDTIIVSKIVFERFSFNETRYINAFINYKTYIETGKKYQQSKILSGNKLSMYNSTLNKGIIKLNDNNPHQINYKVSDFEGNFSQLCFPIKNNNSNILAKQLITVDSNLLINYNLADTFETENLKIFFPANSIYENIELNQREMSNEGKYLSNTFQIHDNTIPIHRNISISIKTDSISDSLKSKLLIVRINDDGKIVSEGGKFSNGFVRTNINIFGKFAVSIDTIAPLIKPLNFSQKPISINQKTIDFKVSDNLSGIAKYRATLNGKWILMTFNGQNNQLTYNVDDKLKNGSNQLKITVEDGRQNSNEMNLIINK